MLPAQTRQELDLRVLPAPDHQRGQHRRQDVMDRHPGPPPLAPSAHRGNFATQPPAPCAPVPLFLALNRKPETGLLPPGINMVSPDKIPRKMADYLTTPGVMGAGGLNPAGPLKSPRASPPTPEKCRAGALACDFPGPASRPSPGRGAAAISCKL
jgi:hypothetical protein